MENTPEQKPQVTFGQKLKLIIGTTLAIFIIVMIVQNWYLTSLSLVFKTFQVPLPLIIIITLITGYVWGSIAGSGKRRRANNSK